MATTDYNIASSLPANVEAERSILGAILLDNLAYVEALLAKLHFSICVQTIFRSTLTAVSIHAWSIWLSRHGRST